LQATDGIAVDVSDDAIAEARGVIGRDGIGCELGSAAALAGILALRKAKWISAEDRVACLLTGHLLKEPDTTGADAAQAAVTLSTDVGASVEHGSVSRD
jgi:threonine synthase